MLPLQQAYEVRESILEYIRATYRFKDRNVGDAFYQFIEDPRHGMIKGPYVSLKTPFISAQKDTPIPLDIKPDFPPYQHQLEAFNRLTTKDGHQPENTLLTTGTGSGKTECFQFPVLDYCWRNRLFRGIKAIILYPMNALATDQASRLAKAIYKDPRLNGQVTVGLFIGRGKETTTLSTQMDETHVIEDPERILDNPPDILLTNFKMLDYGLMRSRYQPLWNNNKGDKNTLLKYLVLDELHTYDGAQGTDVANLIRRLKLKLRLPKGHLCCVGTSATMGNGDDAKASLCQFASDVYGEPFAMDSIIEEHRLDVDTFLDRPIEDPT
ncbi:MAG: DEAD/DEAH box helicase, partial [Prevotella sp.]|nr:DEAD/DEAH box helicase [Prevotella sp.]